MADDDRSDAKDAQERPAPFCVLVVAGGRGDGSSTRYPSRDWGVASASQVEVVASQTVRDVLSDH
ncbi:hypothetical protein AURDEDRAFT_176944 [Auricularia subglabra TFB-10046 SS5]|uniref:Uncharacterized protein n=1 Tax=Auricularia subglabra (strain TFB-10046 / SS5) TaxID=717982 RepID=J0CUJ3_AURST|nr:hypothetical protein AURDEDRAFT_176944 [Auricularia subglabra TFB-10046 SS5]